MAKVEIGFFENKVYCLVPPQVSSIKIMPTNLLYFTVVFIKKRLALFNYFIIERYFI